jgi:hypothetical protein
MNVAKRKAEQTIRLTKAQLAVLGCLADGWVMEPAGRDDMGGCLHREKGEVKMVSAKTVSALFGHGFINPGDAWNPWALSVVGRGIGLMVVARQKKQRPAAGRRAATGRGGR